MPTLFAYGSLLHGEPDHGWIAGLPSRPATVRGQLWRGPRHRPVLVPDPAAGHVRGVIVEVDEARLRVLDLVQGVGKLPLDRGAVAAVSHLRPVRAQTWVLRTADARAAGFRPPKERA